MPTPLNILVQSNAGNKPCYGCHSALPTTSTTTQSALDLPDDFDGEAQFQFLQNFLNPDIDHFSLAEIFSLRLSQYYAYIQSEEFQQRLAHQLAISEMRAIACAKIAQSKAIAALDHILTSYGEAERNEPTGRAPISLNIRQRHRESARRAAWLILRISGAIPPAIAARAKAFRENCAEPAERARASTITITAHNALTQVVSPAAPHTNQSSPHGTITVDPPEAPPPGATAVAAGPNQPATTTDVPVAPALFRTRERAALARRDEETEASPEHHPTTAHSQRTIPSTPESPTADPKPLATSTRDAHAPAPADPSVVTSLSPHLQPSGP